MSSIIKGSRYTPATFRCPTNLLQSALQWEQLRAGWFQARGENSRSENCHTLVRSYENRIRDEAELPKQPS
jgi:hypothetical protein